MRICSGAGCLRAVHDDVRFCDECKPKQTATVEATRVHTTAYDALLDKLRKGTRWQRVRDVVIKRFPLCCRCDSRLSEIVDHIVPAAIAIAQAAASGLYAFDRYAGFYLVSNLQGLCRPCHWLKTNEDKTHVGPWRDVVETEKTAPKRHWAF